MKSNFRCGFAVLMPVYVKDNPFLFQKALQSVYDNSLMPNELWVVADGPLTQSLEDVLNEFANKFTKTIFHLLRLPVNVGLAQALNKALAEIKLPWVVRADADDENLPNRFESIAVFLNKNPELDLISSAVLEVTNAGEPIAIRSVPLTETEIYRFAAFRNPFNHMAVAYYREKVLEVGGYPTVYLKEDYALWSRMLAARAKVANLPDVLVKATAGDEMYDRRGGFKYAVSEFALQRILVQSGIKKPLYAFRDAFLRGGAFLMPSWFRGWYYQKMLRTKLPQT